jgi:hypothetical protein
LKKRREKRKKKRIGGERSRVGSIVCQIVILSIQVPTIAELKPTFEERIPWQFCYGVTKIKSQSFFVSDQTRYDYVSRT